MSDYKLIYAPNKALRKENTPINTDEQDINLEELISSMFEIMDEHEGIGLAAPQIGVNKQLFITNTRSGKKVFINPVIKNFSSQIKKVEEACLSLPGTKVIVERPVEVTVGYLDRDFKPRRLVADRALGRVIQHEMDHLNGILISDYINSEF